jgi:hypothetical protein
MNTHCLCASRYKSLLLGKDKIHATTVSLFSSWTSGDRFLFTYMEDINNDGTGTNDLLYKIQPMQKLIARLTNYLDALL